MITLRELLRHFDGVKKLNASSYQCRCPVHTDNRASLTVSESHGKILLHCHAGCDTREVLEAVGLSFQDLTEKPRNTWRERLDRQQGKRIEAVYDYCAADGLYLYSKVRFEGKELRYLTIDQKNDTYDYCKKKDNAVLYNLPALIRTVREGFPVYIVEGEKDVETLRSLGYTATTAGGVKDWRREYAAYFTGAKVVILPDNDGPGLELKDRITRDLKHYAHSIRWTITSEADKGDVTDYLKKEGHSKEDLAELVQAAPNHGAPWVMVDEKNRLRINGDCLADSISRGLQYLIVKRPDDDKDDFYLYEHGVYVKCNRNRMKSVVRRYIPVGLASDNLINNTCNLLMCRDVKNCSFRDLDTSERYINLRNGLYDLNTGKLEPHTPKLWSTLQLRCEYHPEDNHRPVFDRYINDLCRNRSGTVDEEKKAVLQEYMGLILSNVKVYRVKLCLVLWSLLGNSGKTQFLNLIRELIGPDRVMNLPIQNMNEMSKFSLGSLLGSRLVSIGDQTGSSIKDSSVFKQLTGGDPVKVEQKGRQPFYYQFPGGIIIACNNLPSFQDDKGGHVFERLCIVPCVNTIERELRDNSLLDKMLRERNAVFNWALQGLLRLKANRYRFTRSRACEAAVNRYREKMDTVFRYLTEFYVITGNKEDMISKPEFEDDYISWCTRNSYTPVSRRNIKDRMEASGCPPDKARFSGRVGVMVYRNLKKAESDFRAVDEEEYMQETFPF